MPTKLVHCSYHKCLTVYSNRVFIALYNRILKLSRGYRHFNSLLEEFYNECDNYKISSINNHVLDLDRLGKDLRVTRFIRDPRDLVISGYFYHRRGAEPWCNIIDPKEENWKVVNGCIPQGMASGQSFSAYLQSISQEDGLIAEIDFRRNHFTSMGQWPKDDSRVILFRYEDILGNELKVFSEMFSFYGLSWPEKNLGLALADYFSAEKQSRRSSKQIGKSKSGQFSQHIRKSDSGQWKDYFTPKVSEYFNKSHADILEIYGY
jgi:hypothetical protein